MHAFAVKDALVRVGDLVSLEVRSDSPQTWSLMIVADALGETPRPVATGPLRWETDAKGTSHVARMAFSPTEAGHYNAILIDGDRQIAGRYFAAVDGRQAVCHFFLNGASPALMDEPRRGVFAENYGDLVRPGCIPFEYHVSLDFSRADPASLAKLAEVQFRYGHVMVPMLVARNLGFYERFSLWELTREEMTGAIARLRRLWAAAGLGELEVVNGHWCLGNGNVAALRAAGIRVIAAIVTNYEMRDGESREILTGSPLRPWYAHHEDFRKPADCTEDYVLCLPFSNTIPTEFLRGNPDAHWAPDIQMVWDRSIESTPRAIRSREILDLLCDQTAGEHPFMFPVALQNFGPPAVVENNRNTVRYLLDKARAGRVVFANARAIRDFFLRYARTMPESTLYMRDFMIGSHLINKPIHHPDVIQVHNGRFHAAFERPEARPAYLFDYTRPWHYPDEIFRNFDRHGPEPEDTRGVTVAQRREETADVLTVTLQIDSPRRFADWPIALWELSRRPEHVQVTEGACRFVPVGEPNTHAPHAVVTGPVEAGKNLWRLQIAGARTAPRLLLRDHHGLVGLKTVPVTRGNPYCYLWNCLRIDLPVRLRVPKGRTVWVETYQDGEFGHTDRGVVSVRLDWPRPWARIWNVEAPEVQVDNAAEVEALAVRHFDTVVSAYPLPAWSEAAARLRAELTGAGRPQALGAIARFLLDYQNAYIDAHYETMVRQTRRWFDEATASHGLRDVLLEAYAYAKGHLGGPWRDQADSHNIIRSRPGLRLEVPIYDYAVCHAPGYRAWEMGRAFTLRFFGLSAYAADRIAVYLHCYDYEALGRSYTVRLRHAAVAGGCPVEVLRTTQPLPAGPPGRDDPNSLVRIDIPPAFLHQDPFDMQVLEHYDAKAVDFRKQAPYSVAVSDVWIARL